MRYITLAEVVDLHGSIIKTTGGAGGIRNLGALESAIAQPKATFDMNDLYTLSRERRGTPTRFAFDVLAALVGLSVVLGCLAAGIPLSTFSRACGTSRTKKRWEE